MHVWGRYALSAPPFLPQAFQTHPRPQGLECPLVNITKGEHLHPFSALQDEMARGADICVRHCWLLGEAMPFRHPCTAAHAFAGSPKEAMVRETEGIFIISEAKGLSVYEASIPPKWCKHFSFVVTLLVRCCIVLSRLTSSLRARKDRSRLAPLVGSPPYIGYGA